MAVICYTIVVDNEKKSIEAIEKYKQYLYELRIFRVKLTCGEIRYFYLFQFYGEKF